MALLMEPGAKPTTEDEKADFAAIEAVREEAALELKEQGNEFLKKGKKHYVDAVDCYTRAIEQKTANQNSNSVLFGNRAQVNLLLGNNMRALNDAKDAIKLNADNVKAYYRGAKAALALNLWSEAAEFCSDGLQHNSMNEELKRVQVQVQQKIAEETQRKKRALATKSRYQALLAAIARRHIRIGKALYKEQAGSRKPYLDTSGILHWPVLLLYGEVMVSDLIEDFPETDMFKSHIEEMFGKDAPPNAWDERNEYKRDHVELYYWANGGPVLSRSQLLSSLVEGEVGLDGLDLDEHASEDGSGNNNVSEEKKARWVKVDENMTLHDVVARRNHIIPGIPVFYVVASGTSFREKFLSGYWSSPLID